MSFDRATYAAVYGPTTGDRVRLADTGLVVEVERDDTEAGDELLGGCGKTVREGLLLTSAPRDSELDLVVTNALVLDPLLGVVKTNIGVKDGRIAGLGRAGSPDAVNDVELVVGPHTAMIPAEGMIVTPGIIDSHVHLSSPALLDVALSAGVTTVVGMGLGGVWDIGVNPRRNLHLMIEAWREVPVNVAFLARGSSVRPAPLEAAVVAGAGGFKVHEDFGAQPAVVDTCLAVADAADLPVALHTDSLNESGLLSDTIGATRGRTVHAYHVEGGGGHPDLLEVLAHPHVLASSTTPTLPYTVNTVAELYPMTMTVHRQNALLPGDADVTRSRVRASAIAAENALHDVGAVSIVNSDSMGMGRVGETARRTWQLAAHAKAVSERHGRHDNERVLRYLAKITINPAIAHGMAGQIGGIAPGKVADLVLWHPAWFGAKPELVVKSGFVAWGVSASGAASTRAGQPRAYRKFFGAMGDAPRRLAHVFVAREALEDAAARRALPSGASYLPIRGSRGLAREDMVRNTRVPHVRVPRDGGPVLVDGMPVGLPPASRLPLTQVHHLA
ncbi:urease subunit alpha [Nonomuraea sp. KC401]|uniref:urease subunit alpha n=1 Tax=unclassified Nonomuraea TaxID=2593643 RepID=UPI0010FE7F3B|nr:MULTISPECIES: urease subunit alpha [unclassified Nonomuraea]NBE92619.1 urease subunit alpha [Nonomuraea sp. K271]TLF84572.1 urease subunit alpha [Nonomuraea sp. KC401]